MCTVKTMSCFCSVIVLENFFLINRSYLISDRRTKILCNVIFCISTISIAGVIFYDVYFKKYDANLKLLAFQIFTGFELLYLAVAARHRRECFRAMRRLDDKCGVDAIGASILNLNLSTSVILCLAFSSHDCEMGFISLMINAINIQLSKLENASPVFGCKVYRHILIITTHLNEDFKDKILLMFSVTMITTLIYAMVIILAEQEMMTTLIIVLLWRELKSMYSLWLLCSAGQKTKSICRELALNLANRIVMEPKTNNDKTYRERKIIHRWYCSMMSERPKYDVGADINIDLTIPLNLLDLCATYLLLIVQVYVTFIIEETEDYVTVTQEP